MVLPCSSGRCLRCRLSTIARLVRSFLRCRALNISEAPDKRSTIGFRLVGRSSGCRGCSRSSVSLRVASRPRWPCRPPAAGMLPAAPKPPTGRAVSRYARVSFRLARGVRGCGGFPKKPLTLEDPCSIEPQIFAFWGSLPRAPRHDRQKTSFYFYIIPWHWCSRGRCPRKPLAAERARRRGVFHGIYIALIARASRPNLALLVLGLRPRRLKKLKYS